MVTPPLPSLDSPFQCLTPLLEKKFFLMPNQNLPWHNLRPFPLVLSGGIDWPPPHYNLPTKIYGWKEQRWKEIWSILHFLKNRNLACFRKMYVFIKDNYLFSFFLQEKAHKTLFKTIALRVLIVLWRGYDNFKLILFLLLCGQHI